jgi:SAM-dependent methyltransferase
MTDVWSDRAEGYRTSESHASGDDLETLVAWCEPGPGTTALDVATGGGHVARRLREEGSTVVTSDPAPGMKPDVICHAEDLPFADDSFDVVTSRIAPHHFSDIRAAIAEMARVSKRLVVIEDTLFLSEQQEQAEALRDPTHVRSYSESEWKEMLTSAALEIERVTFFQKSHALDEWLARTGCEGEEATRVTELLSPLLVDGGRAWQDTKILVRATTK